MYKNLRWKFLAIAVIAGLSIWSFTPPAEKVRLGLDLRGGIHLVLRVHTDDALRLETETTAEQLQQALADAKLPVTIKPGLTEFVVDGVPAGSDQQFRQIADQYVSTSFEREAQGQGVYVFGMRPNIQIQRRQEAVTQAIQTIERRVNELGVSEPVVAEYGAGDQIVIQLPGVSDVRRAEEIIRNTAILELKIVEGGPAPDKATSCPACRRCPATPRGSTTSCGRSRQWPGRICGTPGRRSTSSTSRRSASRCGATPPRASAARRARTSAVSWPSSWTTRWCRRR
jgi:preprotein translocase subunit SecD